MFQRWSFHNKKRKAGNYKQTFLNVSETFPTFSISLSNLLVFCNIQLTNTIPYTPILQKVKYIWWEKAQTPKKKKKLQLNTHI